MSALSNLPHRDCPICGDNVRILLYQQRFHALPEGSPSQGYDVVVCSHCGFAFADRIPPQAVFEDYYERLSRAEGSYTGSGDSQFDTLRFNQIADHILASIADKNLRIIDIGCSRGGLLAQLRQRDFHNISGLDPAPSCAKFVHELYNVPVATGTMLNNDLGEHNFDLVILIGVLEHVPNLKDAMQRLQKITSDNAYVVAEVPDAEAFHRWPDAPFQEFSIEHINFFARQSLTNLFSQFGFAPIDVQQLSRHMSKTTVMPSVYALYRKDSRIKPDLVVDTQTEPALRQYIQRSAEEELRIAKTLETLAAAHRRLDVWGAGTHTLHLLETTALARCNIAAYIDSSPKLQGQQLNGRPILAPAAILERSEPILISSRVYQDDIIHQIRHELEAPNELILLYQTENN